jgi:hypothetical protein
MTKFQRRAGTQYELITPSTELTELETFLQHNVFALSAYHMLAGSLDARLT